MRKPLFFLLFAFMFACSIRAEVVSPIDDTRAGVVVKNEGSQLENLIEKFPKVQEAIDKCEAQIKREEANSVPDDQRTDKDTCVWDGVADIQDDIQEHLENAEASSTGKDPSGYAYNLNSFQKKNSKALKKLGDYLGERIQKSLYQKDQAPNGAVNAVDHGTFYSLYESQLGKSLILQVSDYCIYADKNGKVDPNDIGLSLYRREQNLKNLTAGVVEQNGVVSTSNFRAFNACLLNIPKECRGDPTAYLEQKDYQGELYSVVFDRDTKIQDEYEKKADENKNLNIISACELNRYMTGVKLALAKVKDVKKEFGKVQGQSLEVKNLQVNQVNTDKLTNIGSNELVRESGYLDEVKKEAKKLEECANNPNDESCNDYLTSEEDNKKVEDEFFIRGLALKKKIEKDLVQNPKADQEEIKKYFKSKGMTDESYAKLVEQTQAKVDANKAGGATTLEEALKQIIEKEYNNERKALQASLNKRLSDTQMVSEAQKKTANPPNPIANIQKSVERSAEDLAEVVHYSNVVSSFLEVNSSDGSKGQNTTALAMELGSNFFTEEGRNLASGSGTGDKGNLDALKQFAEDDSDSPGANETISLGVEDIDGIQYLEQKN